MNTQTFLDTLNAHKEKQLLFEYAPNQLVAANYHITEVKHITIDSVDCGAQTDSWRETIIQLWESPKEIGKRDFMKVKKALEIINKVGEIKSYIMDSEIKIEYSNAAFHTAQQYIQEVTLNGNDLILKLSTEKTQCKANELCGIPEKEEINIVSSCCEPSSGCC
jgi:regulation of enolase protein 1 (concanavalin A-like superfamily)